MQTNEKLTSYLTSPNLLPNVEKAALVRSPADLNAWFVFKILQNTYKDTMNNNNVIHN